MSEAGSVSLKAIVLVHLILSVWASMIGFLTSSYIYMNAFILAFGIWAIVNPENAEAVFMFFLLNASGIIMDIIFLGIFAPGAQAAHELTGRRDLFRFCLGMSILNLLLRPLSSFFLYKIYQERGGQYASFGIPGMPNFGIGGAGPQGGYENIDQPVPSNNVESASPHSTIDKSPMP